MFPQATPFLGKLGLNGNIQVRGVAPTNPLALRRCNVPWFKVMKPSNPADAAHSAGSIRPSSFGDFCINGTQNVPAARDFLDVLGQAGPVQANEREEGTPGFG